VTRLSAADLAPATAERLAGMVSGGVVPGSVVGVGIDAVDIDRLRAVLARCRHLADRLFTPDERAYAHRASDPVPRLATRFATKESVMKALGLGLGAFGFHDVEVVRDGLDAPRLVLRGAAADLARDAGAVRWHLSLTHTDSLALAVAVADGAGGPA
jgi:holo-[acyl-carrier protein] synthase